MKKLLSFALLALCLATGVTAQITAVPGIQQDLLTAESLWKLGRVGLECLSPDGRSVVYGVQQYDAPANKGWRVLYNLNLDNGKVVQLTDQGESCSNAEWRPDGKRIGYLKNGFFWEVDPNGSGAQLVCEYEMSGFHYSPNGQYIAFAMDAKVGETVVDQNKDLSKSSGRAFDHLLYRHWKSWRDKATYSNIFIAPIQNGALQADAKNIMNEPFDSPLQPDGGMEQVAWSTDSRFVVYTARKEKNGTAEAQSTNSDLYAYDLNAGKAVNLTETNPSYDRDPVFSPDGKYLAYTSLARAGNEADKPRLMIKELASGQSYDLTEAWPYEANDPKWAADSKSLYFLSSTDFTYQLYTIGVEKGSRPVAITKGTHDYTGFKVSGRNLIASRQSMSNPAEIFEVNSRTGDARQITSVNDLAWNALAKGKVERRSVRCSDGKDMNVWVIYPPDFSSAKKYPALLYCQGGPQSPVSQFFSYRWNFQLMAAKGYIVIAPCRRGMPGAGAAWNDAIERDWGGQPMRDLLSATDALAKEPFVDKNRMGAVGASFGGYAVYWLAGNHQNRFKAFIAHCGLFNLESFYGTTEEVWFPNQDFGGAYWAKPRPAMYDRDNPKNYVQNWNTPILVIHNELDFRVPFGEGMQAFQAAQLRGVPSRFLTFPDEGHWMSKPQNSLLWQREFFGWLDKYLK